MYMTVLRATIVYIAYTVYFAGYEYQYVNIFTYVKKYERTWLRLE